MFPVGQFISASDDRAAFNCISQLPGLTSVQWLLNGTQFESLDLVGVEVDFSSRIGLGIIGFVNLTDAYNNTVIRCLGTFSSGDTYASIDASLLIIQGEVYKIKTMHSNLL